MRGEIAIGMPERGEMRVEQIEMRGFFIGHPQPVHVIRGRHARKTMCGVEGQVDGVEFDMGQGMNQCDTPDQGVGTPARHLLRGDQRRLVRLPRLIDGRT